MAEKLKFEDLESSIGTKQKTDDQFKAVGVIGLGVMGHGIAQTVAGAGIEVIGVEKTPESLKAGIDGLSKAMDLEIRRWGITSSEKRAILSRVRGTTDLAELRGCDIIIEAVD
jgi:3-hydroxybutyryl-CoA dehydrogenase